MQQDGSWVINRWEAGRKGPEKRECKIKIVERLDSKKTAGEPPPAATSMKPVPMLKPEYFYYQPINLTPAVNGYISGPSPSLNIPTNP